MENFNDFQEKYVYKRCVNGLPVCVNGKKVTWRKAFGFLSDYEGDIDKIRDDAEARGEEYYYIEVENGRIEKAAPRYVYDINCTLTQEQYDKIFGGLLND